MIAHEIVTTQSGKLEETRIKPPLNNRQFAVKMVVSMWATSQSATNLILWTFSATEIIGNTTGTKDYSLNPQLKLHRTKILQGCISTVGRLEFDPSRLS